MFDSWEVQVSSQRDGREVIAKRKGRVARRGLKEAWSKRASRWTRIGFEAGGAGAKRQVTTKPISIKGTGGKSDGCARKVIELTSGEPLRVMES